MHGANLERCGSLLGQLFTNFLARPAAEVVNACWPYRHDLRHWVTLEKTFQDRVFTRVVDALDAIIGRDQGLLGMSEPLEAPVEAAPAPQKLLNAGPATHGSLTSPLPLRLSPLESARRNAQRLIDQLQVDVKVVLFASCVVAYVH